MESSKALRSMGSSSHSGESLAGYMFSRVRVARNIHSSWGREDPGFEAAAEVG